MVNTEVTRRSEQPLRKQRTQPPLGSQQQPIHMSKPNRHRAQRIPFKMKPKTTWENSAQLLQAGLKREQERGLRYQSLDGLGFSARWMRNYVRIHSVTELKYLYLKPSIFFINFSK
jgi:hypothetical protein